MKVTCRYVCECETEVEVTLFIAGEDITKTDIDMTLRHKGCNSTMRRKGG